ncbi:MAG: oxygenase MpaB family protein [Reinekea sp.]
MRINTRTADPRQHYEAIVRELSMVTFPWDIEKSLEFALYRTYAVPAISQVLVHTGQFEANTQKRYDDTELLLAYPVEHGLDSMLGTQAIERINAMHQRYRIKNELFLYVLSTFVFEPIRWLERYGWRPMNDNEQQAWFLYYRALGEKMQIQDIPESLTEFEQFNQMFEQERFVYHPANTRIASVTRDLLLSFYVPGRVIPACRPAVYAMLDVRLLNAFQFPKAAPALETGIKTALRLRARLLRWLPKNRKEKSILKRKRKIYPMGYAIDDLGTL